MCDQLVRQHKEQTSACLLGLAFEKGTALPPEPRRALELYMGCGPDNLFAQKGIARLGLQRGSLIALESVAKNLQVAADAGDGEACYYLAFMHRLGRGVAQDEGKAAALLQRAASLGFAPAQQAIDDGETRTFQSPLRKFLKHPDWVSSIPIKA